MKFGFTVLPKSKVLISPFPLDPQLMTRPTYLDACLDCLSYVVIFGLFSYIIPRYREVIFIVGMAFLGYTIEFGLIYNNPVTKFHFIDGVDWFYLPLGYSTFAWSFLIVLFFYKLITKW